RASACAPPTSPAPSATRPPPRTGSTCTPAAWPTWPTDSARPEHAASGVNMHLFDHPLVGRFPMRRHVLRIDGADGQAIIAYRPDPGGPAAAALARLAELQAF